MKLKTILSCLTLAIILIFSCKKDSKLLEAREGKDLLDEKELTVNQDAEVSDEMGFHLERDHPGLFRYLKQLEFTLSNSRDLANFDFDNVLLVENDDSLYTHIYTVPLLGNYGNAFYNLIIEEDSLGNFNQPYFFKWVLSFDFLEDYQNGLVLFNEFEGVVQKIVVDDGTRDGEGFYECWTIVFGDVSPQDVFLNITNNPNLPGGSGNPNNNWGDWHSNGNTNGVVILGNGGSAYDERCYVCIACPCKSHYCNESCDCKAQKPTWALDPDCDGQLFGPSPATNEGRDETFDECVRLLVECGIWIPDEILEQCETCPQNDPPAPDEIECIEDIVGGFMAANGIPLCAISKQGTTELGNACCEAVDPMACMESEFFSDPAAATLFQELQPEIGIEEEELCFLMKEENKDLIDDIKEFRDAHINDEGIDDYIKAATEAMNNDGMIVWDRLEELYEQIDADPSALIVDCVTQNPELELNDYSDLMNFVPPSSCEDRLNSEGVGFIFQSIEDGNTHLTNVDYYGIEILAMPDTDNNGTSDTQEELFDALRSNFKEFSAGSYQNFLSSCPPNVSTNVSWEFEYYFPQDENIWNSSDPVTSMFFIDASASNPLAMIVEDDGAVITSQFQAECCWVFSTIGTPLSGSQPFSGNRQFGIALNDNSNLEIYTKAIDRAHTSAVLDFLFSNETFNNCDDTDYYSLAVLTWSNFQNKVAEFINQKGGIATVKPRQVEYIDYSEIKEKLYSETPVNFVSCN